MESIERIFFHELGHFVANQINFECFGGTDAEAFAFYPCGANPYVYCGGFTPQLPPGGNRISIAPHERRAQFIAGVSYGCVFQSYFLNFPTLEHCFKVHGHDDCGKLAGTIFYYPTIKMNLWQCIDNHYSFIKNNQLLDEFKKLDAHQFANENLPNCYDVDIAVLQQATRQLIFNYKSHYCQFVHDLNGLILSVKPINFT